MIQYFKGFQYIHNCWDQMSEPHNNSKKKIVISKIMKKQIITTSTLVYIVRNIDHNKNRC